jgi:hypothetical protein
MSSRGVANPHSFSNRPVTDKAPASKTVHTGQRILEIEVCGKLGVLQEHAECGPSV